MSYLRLYTTANFAGSKHIGTALALHTLFIGDYSYHAHAVDRRHTQLTQGLCTRHWDWFAIIRECPRWNKEVQRSAGHKVDDVVHCLQNCLDGLREWNGKTNIWCTRFGPSQDSRIRLDRPPNISKIRKILCTPSVSPQACCHYYCAVVVLAATSGL